MSEWRIGGVGLSCDAVCASVGVECNAASLNFVSSGTVFSGILSHLGESSECQTFPMAEEPFPEDPSFFVSGQCYVSSGVSTCSARQNNSRRLCCCGSVQCSTEFSSTIESSQQSTSTSASTTSSTASPAAPSSSISTTPATTVPTTSGWIVSQPGQSCDQACSSTGFPCSATSINNLNTESSLKNVLLGLGRSNECTSFVVNSDEPFPEDPSLYSKGQCYPSSGVSTCAAAQRDSSRVCCCSNTDCSLF